mgnify:FL=1
MYRPFCIAPRLRWLAGRRNRFLIMCFAHNGFSYVYRPLAFARRQVVETILKYDFVVLVSPQIMIRRAMSLPRATRESLTFKIIFPPISDTTVTSPPTTKPRLSRNRLVSSLPPIFIILFGSPFFAIVKGIIASSFLCSS